MAMQSDYNLYDSLRFRHDNSSKNYAILKIAVLDANKFDINPQYESN